MQMQALPTATTTTSTPTAAATVTQPHTPVLFFTDTTTTTTANPPTKSPATSFSGYTKSAVFAQWQKCLHKQQYEEACHWTAELDASGWQGEVWQKLILFASKQVHLHCPKLPQLMARNFAYYQLHTLQHGKQPPAPQWQPRNHAQLQQNLCQMIGLVTLSSKGPVYALPSVDLTKIDAHELVAGTHAWLVPLVDEADDPSVVQILSTLLCQVEAKCTHKIVYWLGVLVEFEKSQKQNKVPVLMAPRKPLLPDEQSYRHVYLDAPHASDWVWLLWQALARGSSSSSSSTSGRSHYVKTLKALGYLFAFDYSTSKRNGRLPILLHAIQLGYANVNWTQSIYSAPNRPLIEKACQNVSMLYANIAHTREQQVLQQQQAQQQAQHAHYQKPPPPQSARAAANKQPAHPPSATGKKPKKPSKHTMSEESNRKFEAVCNIDAMFLDR
jgi:hypothetical protein